MKTSFNTIGLFVLDTVGGDSTRNWYNLADSQKIVLDLNAEHSGLKLKLGGLSPVSLVVTLKTVHDLTSGYIDSCL